MNRATMLQHLEKESHWDIIIIGGGATGLGTAIDAATRGYKTLLVEQEDFAKATSSRSTKLLHGGVRYLAQGNFKLVLNALRERGILLKNAPHVTTAFSFIIPAYKWWEKLYYGIGLKLYDIMAGKLGLGNTTLLSTEKIIALLPTIKQHSLQGGIMYKDGQFDDARLAINLAQTASENGAIVLNYCKVTGLIKEDERVTGVKLTDTLNRKEYIAHGTIVINATGVFADGILRMDNALQPALISPSQGVHLVLDKKFFPGIYAMMIPKTSDGRVLFAVPWHNKIIVGTTDTPIKKITLEPAALDEEVSFILSNINRYLETLITKKDVLSVFAGLRPLVKLKNIHKTAIMPRDHTIIIASSGLISITGGKWTTYRKMAKDVIDKAARTGQLAKRKCVTQDLKIHGWTTDNNKNDALHYYGADLEKLKDLHKENELWSGLLDPGYPFTKACVIWAVRYEMAMTVEDVLSRRTRLLFLDARTAIKTAAVVAQLMAEEMGNRDDWIKEEITTFTTLAKRYLL